MTGSRAHFNPRTPVGCDDGCECRTQSGEISIHAPQWGATCNHNFVTYQNCGISIHAPQWGATTCSATRITRNTHFNPRTPVGCDRLGFEPRLYRTYFNPRTPVGCDRPPRARPRTPRYFNPRTPVGCDRYGYKSQTWVNQFQSTHPSGVRRDGCGYLLILV